MTIKELLRAHRLASDSARTAKTVKARETDFDLITVIARQLRRLRKNGETPGMAGTARKGKAATKTSGAL
jgi:hypothetical protein